MNRDEIKYVKEKADIVEIIGHFVQLKRDGSNYKGKSPFTNERTASFTVCPPKNIFKCFSSGKGGDVIDFIMSLQGLSYHDAIKWIRNFYNMPPIDNEWKYVAPIELPISYIPNETAISTIRLNSANNFTKWLSKIFDEATSNALVLKYNIGTSKHWTGANIFWQQDINDRCRSGKIMVYNTDTGKRVKDPEPLITWVHKAAKIRNFNLSSCLFGEHLLKSNPDKYVCIVESEKTAIVASIIYPDKIWISSGSLTNLSYKRCMPLSGRTIVLYPDVGGEQQWAEKKTQLSELIPGNWLIKTMPDNQVRGYDLCDYILDNFI